MHVDEGGPGAFVVGVRVSRAGAGIPLHDDRVAALDELVGGGRQQGDAVFLLFDFPGKSDDHGALV